MPRSAAEQRAWELQCYGCPQEDLDGTVDRWKTSPTSWRNGDPKALVFSMLSDVQALMEMHEYDRARQTVNCCKYILDEHVHTGWPRK